MSQQSVNSARDRTWLVAIAAAFWGTSALMREPLAAQMPAATIVLYEHLLIVLCLLPWLPSALRGFLRASARVKASLVVIGGGSSALAATLFTAAFSVGDPITPPVLQKLQPVLAMLLAALFLRERITPRFGWFAIPAVVGAWLLTFADPFAVSIQSATAALLALGAALLWAGGTVFGRLAGSELQPLQVTSLRFLFGLVAAGLIVAVRGDSPAFTPFTASNVLLLALLALVPGLLSLLVYYRGLRNTPASRATLAELAFPVTAAVVGVAFLGQTLVLSQWLGFGIVVAAVTTMSLYEQSERRATTVAVREPVVGRAH